MDLSSDPFRKPERKRCFAVYRSGFFIFIYRYIMIDCFTLHKILTVFSMRDRRIIAVFSNASVTLCNSVITLVMV